jgi:lysozyme
MKLLSKLTTVVIAGSLLVLRGEFSQGANLLGIDVSSIQGSINWSSVHSCGAQFAFAKATEGTYYQDSFFKRNMTNGKAAGLQMGAYHFARPDVDCPAAEADYFWNFAGPYIIADGKSLFPAIDFETVNGHSCQPDYTAWLNAWSTRVKSKTSHFLHPVAIVGCVDACLLSTATTLEEWGLDPNGPWKSCPCCNWINPCTTNGWTYWLVSLNGSICGVSGSVDLDQYNGNLSSLISTQGVH